VALVKQVEVSQEGLAVSDALPADIPDPTWPRRPKVSKATMWCLEVKVWSLVIGEGWQAWLATAWAVFVCVMCDKCAVDKLEAKPADWESKKAWEEFMMLWMHVELMFVLGSVTFVKKLVDHGLLLDNALVSLHLTPGLRQRRLRRIPVRWDHSRHCNVGGAMDAVTWVGVGQELVLNPLTLLLLPVERRMRDSLSSVEGGPAFAVSRELDEDLWSRRVREPLQMEADKGWLHPGGLLLVGGRGNLVVSPSVFLHSGWALRRVTGAELGQMWDLPMKWKQLFGGYPDQINHRFTCTVPAKVLWQYTARVDKFGIMRGEAERDLLDLMPSFGIIPCEDLHLDNRFAKAVKNDDDEVPVHIWNNFAAEAVNIPLTPDVEQAFQQIQRGLLG